MRRPAIPFALALALAIAAGRAFGPVPSAALATLLAAAGSILAISKRGRPRAAAPLALALGLAAGDALEWNADRRVAPDDVRLRVAAAPAPDAEDGAALASDATALTGRVLDEPMFRASDVLRYTAFRLEAESIERPGAPPERVSGAVLVYIWHAMPEPLAYGDHVRLRGALASPRGPTNPGEADRRAALADERIHAIFSVPRRAPVEVLARGGGSLMGAVFALRARLRRDLLDAVPGEAGAFLDSILLGTRTVLREEVIQDFQRTGTIHMLVVSGLHTSLLAAFLWLVFRRALRLPAPVAICATLALAAVYCLLTGAQPSILRATIMIGIVLFGRLLHREADTLNSLALAAVAILALSPGSVRSAGFELSFAAIVGLELIARPLQRALAARLPTVGARAGRLRRAGILAARWAGGAACASIGAFIATEPLVAWRFHLVTPGIVVANLAALAVCSAVLYSGFALLFVAPLSKVAAAPLAFIAGRAALLFLWLVHALARMPGAYLYVADIPGWRVLGAYAAIGGLAGALSRWAEERLPPLARAMFAAAFLLGAATFLVPPGPRPVGRLAARLAVLDVGTGATAVLRTDSATVLFDCGGGRIETGTRVTAPYLWSEGVRRIDAVYLSHAHADHVNALLDVADRFEVGRVYVGPWFGEAEGGARLLAVLEARRIPVEALAAGSRTAPGAGIEVEALAPCSRDLAPPHVPREPTYEGQNNTSLVLRVRVAGQRLLFPGDIQADGVALLVRANADFAADLTLIPHHGGPDRRIEDFVELAAPRIAVASAKPGFSSPKTIAAFDRAGAAVRETAAGGAVLVDLAPGGIEARSFVCDAGRGPPTGRARARGRGAAAPALRAEAPAAAAAPVLAAHAVERRASGEAARTPRRRGRRAEPPPDLDGPDAFPPCGEPRIVAHPPLPSAGRERGGGGRHRVPAAGGAESKP
jgi:competence protein ComEC